MPTDILVPELGESVLEATVARWIKHEGEHVSAGDVVVELETDKVNLDVAAPQDGIIARIERQEGEDVEVGQILGTLDEVSGDGAAEAAAPARPAEEQTTAAPAPEAEVEAEAEQPAPRAEPEERPEHATPVARRLAEERGIDLAQVSGSGPRGRITREDVERHAERPAPQPEPAAKSEREPAHPIPSRPSPAGRREERQRMSRRRRTIARRLVEAQQTAAMLTTFNDVDMSAVLDLRQRHKERFQEQHGVGLGISSFFVKAAIGALKAFPRLNAEIQEDEIVLKYYYDIGVAIGAEEGLVVPVLRDADRMSFAEIEAAIKRFAQQAQEGTLSLEDLRGGTFTITNGGIFGSLLSTPILNPPQVGILGLHRFEDRPVVVDGEVVVHPMMYLALSYDHRIVDGREAVQFLARIKTLIKDPESLLLEG